MYGLVIRAYSLMPNHVHHVAVPERTDSVAKTFHRAQGMYSKRFNEKHGYVGHLWQERPFSCVLSEAHTRNAIRYVENNPVRAGMVSTAEEYRWSSARAHCNGESDPLLDFSEPRAIEGWSAWLQGGADPRITDLIRECTFTGRPCGDETFVEAMEKLTGRHLRPKSTVRLRRTLMGMFRFSILKTTNHDRSGDVDRTRHAVYREFGQRHRNRSGPDYSSLRVMCS
jgi:putative transposase